MTYTQIGPWNNGGAPGLSAAFFNGLETWLLGVDQSSPTVLSGSTSGTATLYQPFAGTFKLVIVQLATFRNGGGSAQTIAIPTPFTTAFHGWNSGSSLFQVKLGGVVQTAQQLTSFSAGSTNGVSPQTSIFQNWLWHCDAGADTISFNASQASPSTSTAQIILFGI